MTNAATLTHVDRLARVNDDELLRGLHDLVAQEQRNTAGILVHLAEVEARRLHLQRGYSSMFGYCTGALRMSEHAAYHRIEAARAARKFPAVLDYVESGRIHLTGVKLLARHFNDGNASELLEAATDKTRREIEVLLAERFPLPDVVDCVRKLPAPRQRAAPTTPKAAGGGDSEFADSGRPAILARSSGRRSACQPLAPERFKIQFTADRELHDKLRQAQALLRHQIPNGDIAKVISQALDGLITQTKKQRFGQTKNQIGNQTQGETTHEITEKKGSAICKKETASSRTRHIPNRIKRQVVRRDGEQCTFVSPDGKRCAETGWLEFHHRHVPFAIGGQHTVDNLTLHCRAHNYFEGERVYGKAEMRRQS